MKTAFITGSSRGIGRAIAIRLAKEGYNIILHGSRKSKQLEGTRDELKKLGTTTVISNFDISNRKEVEQSCKLILKKVKKIDVLVNNAGITRDRTFIKMTDEEWDDVIKTNLYGTYYVTKQILPIMKEYEYGRIINIASIAGERGAFGKSNYSASKAGIIGFTKSLALELGKYNITVNAVCPGYINTEMAASIQEKYRTQFLSQIALSRIGEPYEVANLVSFLAGSDSSYITGAVIDINGGWL